MQPTPPWTPGRPWQDHPATYRATEMRMLARWISVGAGGSVIGLRGVGRSNLLGFLCHRPDALRQQIEPDPATPVYLVNWRGKPEGGYLFFPEGKPT